MLQVSEYSLKEEYNKILNLGESIRFVGIIKNRHVVAFVRRKDFEPLIDEEMGNLAHYQVYQLKPTWGKCLSVNWEK